MPHEILEHTADFRVRVYAATAQMLFSDALRAMNDILGPTLLKEKSYVTAVIMLEAPDLTALLIDFLNDVLLQTELQRTAFRDIVFHTFTETALRATLSGSRFECLRCDIKAVTWHEADVRRNSRDEWETIIVFDI
ncbi:archease [Chlorobium limicola]